MTTPGASTWKMVSGSSRSFKRDVPNRRSPKSSRCSERANSAVAAEQTICPPCAAAISRAARLTAGPK